MQKVPQISESELEVMKIVWQLNETTSGEIVDRLIENTDWKPKTIQTLITRLVAKGALRADQTGGKAYLYSPLISEQQYKTYANQSFLQKLYNGSVNQMLSSFIKEQQLTKLELENLKKLLDEETKP